MNLAFDECGYTGEHLLDAEQWVFVLGSTSLSDAEATELLSCFEGRTQGEYKYTKLKRAKRNRPLIQEVLVSEVVTSSTAKSYVFHKPFMVVTKIVDNIYEPIFRETGGDLYKEKGALALANLISSTWPVFLGKTRFARFLELFSQCYRTQSEEDFQRFRRESLSIYEHFQKKHPYAVDVLAPVIEACRRGRRFFEHHTVQYDHDPIIPAYFVLVNEWSKSIDQRFTILADESKTLASERGRLLALSDPGIEQQTAYTYDKSVRFPLKVDDVRCLDSKSHGSIQFADFLAGAVCHAWNFAAIHGPLGGFEKDLFDTVIEKNLLVGGVWPGTDVTPEDLEATGEYSGNLAEIVAGLSD